MGVRMSFEKVPSTSRNKMLVVTLDALNTLYRFKEPVAVQYKNIASQCGLKGNIATGDLEGAFRKAYKDQSKKYPNYGKGTPLSPEQWWHAVVTKTFRPLVHDEELPEELGTRLYQHFASGSAYELFPDVKPFLDTMNKLKARYRDPAGPMLVTGIITNSDPRVRQVLGSLGVRVGPSELPDTSFSKISSVSWQQTQDMVTRGTMKTPGTPMYDYYNSMNDFDFLATSYDAGGEKPGSQIFTYARYLTKPISYSRYEQYGNEEAQGTGLRELAQVSMSAIRMASEFQRRTKEARWIHVGDDWRNDIEGASQVGIDTLFLDRDGIVSSSSDGNTELKETIPDLGDAANVISLLTQQSFADSDAM